MVTLETVRTAAARIAPHVRRTPLIDARWARLKLEMQQPTGSFKVRPAFNGILTHEREARAHGVITSSSGNFAQAVALAGRELGVDAVVVMTSAASRYKVERTRALGARLQICGDS